MSSQLLKFPPFYTKQPNEQTWQTQQSQWIQLLLAHCKTYKIWTMNLKGQVISHSSPISPVPNIFENTTINRKLTHETIKSILLKMVEDSNAEYINKSKKDDDDVEIMIYWNKPEIWASLILQYVETKGLNGGVLTFMELCDDDSLQDQEFYMIYKPLLIKSLEILQKRGRATLMKDEDGVVAGVKIY